MTFQMSNLNLFFLPTSLESIIGVIKKCFRCFVTKSMLSGLCPPAAPTTIAFSVPGVLSVTGHSLLCPAGNRVGVRFFFLPHVTESSQHNQHIRVTLRLEGAGCWEGRGVYRGAQRRKSAMNSFKSHSDE